MTRGPRGRHDEGARIRAPSLFPLPTRCAAPSPCGRRNARRGGLAGSAEGEKYRPKGFPGLT